MKVRLLAVIVLITTVFFSSLVWLLDSFFYGDRGNWAEMSLRTQVSVISEAVSNEAKFLQRWVSFANEDKLKQMNWTAFSPYAAIAVLQKSGPGWIVMEWSTDPKGTWSKVSKESFQSTLQSLGIRPQGKVVNFSSYVDAEKKASVFSIVPTSHRTWIFVHGGEALQSVIDSQKGSWSSLGIINREGLTLAHSIPEYIGQKMAKSTLQQDLLKGETVSGSGTYNMGESTQVFAYYQKVPDVEAYVYSTMPVSEVMKGRKKLLAQLALLALGLILTVSSFVLKFSGSKESPDEQTLDLENVNLPPPSAPVSAMLANKSEVPVDSSRSQKEKMEAYAKMASALGHELRAPLLSIMGYGQTLMGKVTEPESKKMLESLVNEARTSRTVLDKLFIFAGEKVQDRLLMKIETPLLRALKNLEPLFQQKRVKVIKDIHETQAIYINSENLIRAFENILHNSVESMERQADKEIHIKLQDLGSKIEVSIRDKGEGIDPSYHKKIFEPFYTTRGARQQLGLGLSVSHGVFKEHSAEVDIQSQVGQGTTVVVSFEKVVTPMKAAAPVERLNSSFIERKKAEKNRIDLGASIPKYNEIELEVGEEQPAQQEGAEMEIEEDSFLMINGAPVNAENILLNPAPTNPAAEPKVNIETSGQNAKPSLDVNVDQLLDLPDEFQEDDKTVVTGSSVTEAPTPIIGPPKKAAVKKISAVEEFKVVVRKPERKS